MKVEIKLIIATSILASLLACGDQNNANTPPVSATPSIPTYTLNQLLDMTKNERQEIERRCLGITHQTCTDLKSDSFRKLKELRISTCNLDASYKGLSDAGEAARARRKCDDLF